MRQEGFAVSKANDLTSLDASSLAIAPFAQAQNRGLKSCRGVLYLAEEKDIESEAFATLAPHEDVLIRPFSEEQLKYRLLAMLR